MTRFIKLNKDNRQKIVDMSFEVLNNGGLLVFPTETLYGIGADATNPKAIDKLLTYKARREGKPLSVAVDSIEMAQKYVEVNETALNIYKNFLPGPITVVSKGLHKVAKGVESETGTLGIRIPDHKMVLDIVKKLGRPITATSANASYKKRPYSVKDILGNVSQKQKALIDLVIDAGELPKREPSTVIDTTLNEKRVLRQGDIKLTKLEEVETNSPEETRAFGANLIKKYAHYMGYKSLILAMQGELGAGKTEMTKGIAKELGIKEAVNSPTFIIEKEYRIKGKKGSHLAETKTMLYHIDTWRFFETEELAEIGFFNQVAQNNVFVIEWADKITEALNRASEDAIIIWIKIAHGQNETARKITVSDYDK